MYAESQGHVKYGFYRIDATPGGQYQSVLGGIIASFCQHNDCHKNVLTVVSELLRACSEKSIYF